MLRSEESPLALRISSEVGDFLTRLKTENRLVRELNQVRNHPGLNEWDRRVQERPLQEVLDSFEVLVGYGQEKEIQEAREAKIIQTASEAEKETQVQEKSKVNLHSNLNTPLYEKIVSDQQAGKYEAVVLENQPLPDKKLESRIRLDLLKHELQEKLFGLSFKLTGTSIKSRNRRLGLAGATLGVLFFSAACSFGLEPINPGGATEAAPITESVKPEVEKEINPQTRLIETTLEREEREVEETIELQDVSKESGLTLELTAVQEPVLTLTPEPTPEPTKEPTPTPEPEEEIELIKELYFNTEFRITAYENAQKDGEYESIIMNGWRVVLVEEQGDMVKVQNKFSNGNLSPGHWLTREEYLRIMGLAFEPPATQEPQPTSESQPEQPPVPASNIDYSRHFENQQFLTGEWGRDGAVTSISIDPSGLEGFFNGRGTGFHVVTHVVSVIDAENGILLINGGNLGNFRVQLPPQGSNNKIGEPWGRAIKISPNGRRTTTIQLLENFGVGPSGDIQPGDWFAFPPLWRDVMLMNKADQGQERTDATRNHISEVDAQEGGNGAISLLMFVLCR
ncbi:hypothetical protein COT75_00935 [Candidatus Beckwithbacteria bacterium CG10_big_fil_rev_8_21_14_0_10_34_10]|uniref:Uncharacterized protein n=1 Tax=Candidatus Beckwithbacteria bacterium CG10_big_fil_rev_8_21_14_0_10_34_10 TaxID=1974495 RepID=A0A2H0WA68_9BACT|nr:MAG: hypothetical protein COT75_00935 [Candidatus Beckwithbacteria bacterium CG10_big_fil_rev_8_21_14_0_10_34_10]